MFLFGCAGSALLQGLSLAAMSGGCPPVAVLGFSVAEHGLAVGAHGLSCPAAGGILLDPGSERHLPELASGFLTTGPAGKPFTRISFNS